MKGYFYGLVIQFFDGAKCQFIFLELGVHIDIFIMIYSIA